MKRFLILIAFLICLFLTINAQATSYKGFIGSDDINWWDGVTRTFDRKTSTGGNIELNKIGNAVDVLEVFGDGTAYTDTTISTAIGTVGSTNKVALILQPGQWMISNSFTTTSNIEMIIPPGAQLVKAEIIGDGIGDDDGICEIGETCASVTVAINGPFDAGLYQVFSGFSAGDVTFGTAGKVYPKWWGENTTPGTTDMTDEILSAVESMTGGNIQLYGGIYQISEIYLKNGQTLEGVGHGGEAVGSVGTILRYTGTGACIAIKADGTTDPSVSVSGSSKVHIKNLRIEKAGVQWAAAKGIQWTGVYGGSVEDVMVYGFLTGIEVAGNNGEMSHMNLFLNNWISCTNGYHIKYYNAAVPPNGNQIIGGRVGFKGKGIIQESGTVWLFQNMSLETGEAGATHFMDVRTGYNTMMNNRFESGGGTKLIEFTAASSWNYFLFNTLSDANVTDAGSNNMIMRHDLNSWVIPVTPQVPSIAFPATQAPSDGANTLDDYEEGTWTPALSFGGATVGITYSGDTSGFYTKVGNVVTLSGYIKLTSKGSSVGSALVTGLPFTVVATYGGLTPPALWFKNITFTGQYQGYTSIDTTTINLNQTTEAGVMTALTDANFADNSELMVNITYRVK